MYWNKIFKIKIFKQTFWNKWYTYQNKPFTKTDVLLFFFFFLSKNVLENGVETKKKETRWWRWL